MKHTALLRQIGRNLRERCGLKPTRPVLLSYSGGVDSTALAEALSILGWSVHLHYFQHGLRGTESWEEEALVRELAARWKFPLQITNLSDRFSGPGFQEEARNLRRSTLELERKKAGAQAILTAHHTDDVWETVIMRLLHGGGHRVWAPMLWKEGPWAHPLLDVTKRELTRFLEKQMVPWAEDSSNAGRKYLRNRIRLELLPQMEKLHAITDKEKKKSLARWRVARLELEEGRYQMPAWEEHPQGEFLRLESLESCPDPEVLLESLLRNRFSGDAWKIWGSARTGGKGFADEDHRLFTHNNGLLLTEEPEEKEEVSYTVTSSMTQLWFGNRQLDFNRMQREEAVIRPEPWYAWLDADTLEFPLTLRRWKAGDKFRPLGMKGFQKISDYLTNRKLSVPEKENTWVLCSGNRIVWLVGHRISDDHKLVEESRMVYLVRLSEQ